MNALVTDPHLSAAPATPACAVPLSMLALVEKLLEAYRDGCLKACCEHGLTPAERAGLAKLCQPIQHLFGAEADVNTLLPSVDVLLQWSVDALRHQQNGSQSVSEAQTWLEWPAWRPLLALLAHYRFINVPDFPGIYTNRRNAPIVEHLCGLWYIGPSSFYRYLDTARHALAQLWHEQIEDARHLFDLLAFACAADAADAVGAVQAKHRRWAEAVTAQSPDGILTVLWHRHQAGDYARWAELADKMLPTLAAHPQTAALLSLVLAALPDDLPPYTRAEVLLVQIALHRARNETELELAACVAALHALSSKHDPLALAAIYAQLGKHYEFRDPDRSFAYYQEALRYCGQDAEPITQPRFRPTYAMILVKLAWLYVNRNDPRAKTLLERAHASCADSDLQDSVKALYEQALGEYLRHQGLHHEALEHKLQALLIYERLNDEEGQIKTFINLGNTYDDLQQYERAIHYYQRVLQQATMIQLAPDLIVTTLLNMGVSYFWLAHYAQAIAYYNEALVKGQHAGLTYRCGQAHYNLAEAYYVRWIQTRGIEDEQRGDQHVALAYDLLRAVNHPSLADGVRQLKGSLLAGTKQTDEDRLIASESAAHFAEQQEINQLHALLSAASLPHEIVQARLALADVYLRISLLERQEATALARQHDLLAQFTPEIDRQRARAADDLTRKDALVDRWQAQASVVDAQKQSRLLSWILEHGEINKSGYAELCAVSLATASKHLALLTKNGLLCQIGRGPATRYVLVDQIPHQDWASLPDCLHK